jgi:hypothetical protein
MIDVTCSQCGAVYHSDETHVGKHLRCARCGSLVPILGAARKIVSQPISAPSAPQVHQAQARKSASRFKSSYMIFSAFGILLVFGGVGLVVHRIHTGTASVSDIDNAAAVQQSTPEQGSHTEPTIIGEEPIPTSDKPTSRADPRPAEYNSLPTGTRIEDDVGTGGHGELTVDNGSDEDAVVRLAQTDVDETVRWFFVKTHATAHIRKIPAGTYALSFTTGLNWVESEDTFSWHPSYSEFERSFEFKEQHDSQRVEYHSISVTLHSVPFGNVRTRAITRAEFLKSHKHVALQR